MVIPRIPSLYHSTKHNITLEGHEIAYTVKQTPRARRVRLIVDAKNGLTVNVPLFFHKGDLPDILANKSKWILSKLAKFGRLKPQNGSELKNGDSLPYLGKRIKLVFRRNSEEALIRLEGKRLLIYANHSLLPLSTIVERWYRRQAEQLISEKAASTCSRLGVNFNQLRIRGAKTRWASCSKRGNLNFNWKLMMAPEPVIDYVIIHELSHIKEMNHSKRFWALVAESCPDWKKHRKWLQAHERELASIIPVF